MKLFVGLGNPGEKYEYTRHNVGWKVIDSIANSNGKFENQFDAEVLKQDNILLVKPQTFMNDSGRSVQKLMHFYKIDPNDIYVIHDDMDIKLGEYKIQKGVGPKLHGGINSIEKELGTSNFWRVRIGVENRDLENKIPGDAYVLQNFSKEEIQVLNESIAKIISEILD